MSIRTLIILLLISAIQLSAQPDTAKYQVYINKAMAPGNYNSYNRRIYLIEEGEVKVLNLIKTISDTSYSPFKNMFGPISIKDVKTKDDRLRKILELPDQYIYDTTRYKMNTTDELLVRQTLRSIHCLDDFMHDPAWMDGLRFIFHCKIDTSKFHTWMSNVYYEKIGTFIGIINHYVPEEWYFWYDKKELLNVEDCD